MAGPDLPLLAWRNLWRNPRRTAITLGAIAFGMFLALFFTGLQDKSFSDMIDSNARNIGGHVLIEHPEYLDTPTLTRTVKHSEALVAMAEQDSAVDTVVERIQASAMVQSARESGAAMLLAIDPARETPQSFRLLEALQEGEAFASAEDTGMVLGDRLARNLDVGIGDKVRYTLINADGDLVAGMERVRGILRTGSPNLDAALCLIPLDRAREALGYGPDESVQIGVFLKDGRQTDAVVARLQPQLPEGARAVAWSDVAPELSSFIAMKVGGSRFMEIVIALLVLAGIFNTLFVSVMERMREFGIQLAIGYRPGQIFRMVLWESLFLALVGVVVGLLIFAGPYYYMARYGVDMTAMVGTDETMDVAGVGMSMVMQMGIYPENLAIIVGTVILATLVAGLYPAWRAGRVEPVDVIRLV